MVLTEIVVTKCCGTIAKCDGVKCLLTYVFGGGGKCVRCNWIYDMMPGVDARPITAEAMRKAHE